MLFLHKKHCQRIVIIKNAKIVFFSIFSLFNKMKKIIPILLFVQILFITGCVKEKQGSGVLSLLTYNVAGLPEGLSGSHPLTYTSHIAPLLNEYDIVNVQEDFCYHDSLLRYVDYPYITPSTGCVPGGDGVNTFSRFPFSNLYREAWLNCTSTDCLTPKGFSYVQVTVSPGVTVDLYNVHANSGSSDIAKEARRYNLIQLQEYIKKHSSENAVIVMGDFNSRYTRVGDTVETMLGLGFKDVWLDLIRKGSMPEKGNSLSACDPDRNAFDCEKIDKVFYRSSDKVLFTPLSYQLDDSRYYYQNNDTLPLSDHWPLNAKLIYTVLK